MGSIHCAPYSSSEVLQEAGITPGRVQEVFGGAFVCHSVWDRQWQRVWGGWGCPCYEEGPSFPKSTSTPSRNIDTLNLTLEEHVLNLLWSTYTWIFFQYIEYLSFHFGLPGWLNDKESACQCRPHRLNPWVRKIPWSRKWQRTPIFLPGKSHGQRSLAGCSPWGSQRVGRNWVSTHTFSFYQFLSAGKSLCLITDHSMWDHKKPGLESWFYPDCFSFLLFGESFINSFVFEAEIAVCGFSTAVVVEGPTPVVQESVVICVFPKHFPSFPLAWLCSCALLFQTLYTKGTVRTEATPWPSSFQFCLARVPFLLGHISFEPPKWFC